MNYLTLNDAFKYSNYFLILIVFYLAFNSFFNIKKFSFTDEVLNLSTSNQIINSDFESLFIKDDIPQIITDTSSLFNELGVELVGIVSINEKENNGYILLDFKEQNITKKIYRPGEKIMENIFLEKIRTDYIQLRIDNEIHNAFLLDNKKVTEVNGIIILDVTLMEILPYLTIKEGKINNTLGVYIDDKVDGKILEKLNLKKTDLLFNLSGNNVFNLATLGGAYKMLDGQKDIIASIYRDGKIKKIVVRRLDD